MPGIEDCLPSQSRNALARRAARQVKVVQYVKEVEVASIALQLRRERRSLEKLLNVALKAGDTEQVSTLHSCLHKTREQLLRIAQVPNPPAGRAGRKGRGMVDLQSVFDVVPGAPEECPVCTADGTPAEPPASTGPH